MKTSKRIISFVLCAVMVASCFFCTGKLPELEAKAATVGGFTQTRVVDQNLYKSYQKKFFLGEETNWPTDFVLPGLSSDQDYTPQGMTYWAEKEWILISAYDAGGSDHSVIYALDVVSTDLVAVFKIENADGTVNTSHGGGIAASKYNFYYADSASKVSYVPLSDMDVDSGVHTIRLKDSVDFAKEMTGAETGQTVKTSYCCYDDGILWTGNFNWSGETQYAANYHAVYKSILMGYKLAGNSSDEEWYYLKNGYNLATITRTETETPATVYTRTAASKNGVYNATMNYTKIEIDGAHLEVRGSITTNATPETWNDEQTRIGEVTTPNNIASFNLVEGKQYKISFVSTNKDSDIYMWSPGGKHCNVKQASTSTKRELDDGRWYYEMIFTAGVKPNGADSGWQAAGTDDGTNYTGTYTIRIDQDGIIGNRDFAMTDISVCEYNGSNVNFNINPDYEGVGCAGNPTHVIAMDTDRIQYAMVDKGKLYVSRSWSRSDSGNHTRELMIADIDLNRPGDTGYTVNGRLHNIHLINYNDATTTHFGGNFKASDNGVSAEERNKMLWMGEALCVIDDYLYMFGEGAAWAYNGKEDSKCGEPIDVIWKIDQYAIQGLQRPHEDVTAVKYEKVYSLSDINDTAEYIVLYESSFKDPVTQDNILYLLDSYGGYGDKKLPKKTNPNATDITAVSTGDSRGVVGYEIRDYSVTVDEKTGKENLIINAEDDANKSLHWQFGVGSITTSGTEESAPVNIKNRELYYAKHPYLYIGDTFLAMTTNASSTMKIKNWGGGTFTIYGNGDNYSLWCNDGSVPASISAYTNFYGNHGQTGFVPNYHGLEEQAGTFHVTNGGQPALPTNEQQGLQIYKRESNPYTSSYETQVYTDLKAELTKDGTYDIILETYATNNLQYQRVEKARPTDFIFVLDSSGSLDAKDSNAYKTDSSWSALKIKQIVGDSATEGNANGINLRDGSEKFYYQTSDGTYHPIYASVKTTEYAAGFLGIGAKNKQTYWCYYINIYDGLYYMLKYDGAVATTGITYDQLVSNINNTTSSNMINASGNADNINNSTRKETPVWGGKYYSYSSGHQRLDGIKNAVDSLTYKIASQASSTGLDHRIALCSFGTDGSTVNGYQWEGTNLYTNSGAKVSYPNIIDANYQNAFFSVSQFGTLRNVIAGMKPLGHTYPSYGLDMASKIIDNSNYDYDVNGTRSAVVIVISDGVTGWEEDDDRDLNVTKQVANDTLANGAYNLKRNGAYIYSVLLGNDTHFSETDYDERDFMKYLSSEYTGSKSLTDPGPHNTKEGVDYYKQIESGANFDLYDITDEVFNEVVANSNNAIASMTSEAILREQITDAFDLTNATISYQTAKSTYDGIGRLSFEDPVPASGFDTTFDRNTNEITVSGFDYSANNVSEYNSDKGLGKKLIVTISGVVADRNQILSNASINDDKLTALYQNEDYMEDNLAVKKFPTYHFSIPEYTYVMDYDLPMLDTDINGTLVSVDTAPVKQDITNYTTNLQTDVFGVQFAPDENGLANQNMYYSLNSQDGSAEDNSRAYVLIKRDDGTYDWFRLNLLPASTVYYEDNKTATLAGTTAYVGWEEGNYSNYVGKYQTLSSKDDVFGSDPTYSSSSDTFSLGTYLKTTVSSSNNRSETKTFSFKGTGFDLISACAPNTGIQTVVVKDAATGEIEKIYVVDTYYNDSAYNTIYQAPIVHFEGLYKEYIVETTAAYYSFAGALNPPSATTNALGDTGVDAYTAPADTAVTDEFFAAIGMDELIGQEVDLVWMDEDSVLNGGEGAVETTVSTQAGEAVTTSTPATSLVNYIDGFRIYNPLEGQYSNAYYPENEKNSSYFNLMSCIGSGAIEGTGLFAYIEGSSGNFSFAEYTGLKGKGPTNEVYLTKNDNGLSFKISVSDIYNVSAKLSMRAIKGQPTVKINNKTIEIKSTSEQYYDVTEAIKSASNGVVTINVSGGNAGDLVAIGNLRLNNATLVNLANDDLENVARMMTMAATPLSHDPFTAYSPAPTFSQAPADDPNIDPIGKLPSLEEYIAQNGIKVPDDHSGADRFADKLVAIIDKIIEFIKKAIVLVANAVTSIF